MKVWMHFCSLVLISVLSLSFKAEATFSRLESMGKSADFFMDDVSIFSNPANINIFPNFLIGEMGSYRNPAKLDTSLSSNRNRNLDPENSWFGGLFSYSLSKNKDKATLSPQISIGGAFNRLDTEILPLTPDSADGFLIPDPATNFDGFLGMTFRNGGMIGSHIYIAKQDGADLSYGKINPGNNIRFSLMRGDLGVNMPLNKSLDGEISLGGAETSYGPEKIDPKLSFFVKARLFSSVDLINGEMVPIASYSNIAIPGKDIQQFHVGLGANVSLDRGFFWLGLKGILENQKTQGFDTYGNYAVFFSDSTTKTKQSRKGISIGFGIERNIWWDWLVLRVGGHKVIAQTEVEDKSGKKYSFIYTNPTGDMTSEDQIGFGIGVNIEEKLKVDATLAEDLPYTFGNFFSGPRSYIISRISATYSF